MSYIVRNKDDKLLISFSKVKDDEFMILATNLKQFYVQKGITSEMIEKMFKESDTRIRRELTGIIKIMQDQQPECTELEVNGCDLNLVLKFQLVTKTLCDYFKMNFKLKECTSFPEIGELFFTGLLKTIIEEKLKTKKTEKINVNLPRTSFEATFKINDSNISDLCELIGGDVVSKTENSDQKPVEQVKEPKVPTKSTTQRASKRQMAVYNQFKFEQLNDSQELDTKEVEEPKEVPNKTVKNTKKKMNIKF